VHALRHATAVVCLLTWLVPCRAQDFADETLRALFLTYLLADRVRNVCAGVDPALGDSIDTSLARVLEAHAEALLAGRAVAQRVAPPKDSLETMGQALADRFTRALQQENAQQRHARCSKLAAQIESSAMRSRRELVEPAFRRWFAQQQRARGIECTRLHGTTRSLAQRLLSGSSARAHNQQLRADARVTARAADWCLQAQAAAAREGIEVPGKFGLIGETSRAIADAAMPLLSGGDPGTAGDRGRHRAMRYLAEPD
jgi:hypothetical protein